MAKAPARSRTATHFFTKNPTFSAVSLLLGPLFRCAGGVAELVTLTGEAEQLARHYIIEGVLTPKFESDAQHIALSAILKVDSLISWNFKHMVNFFRIRQYNSINLKFGYQTIDIRTLKEVIYANED